VKIERVDAGDVRVARLLQLYLHEWSAVVPKARIGKDALFPYDDAVDDAWLFVDDDDGRLLGFAFTTVAAAGRSHVEEFFVLLAERRRGTGTRAAHALFGTRPGPWTFTVRPEKPGALTFWRRAVAEAGGGVVESVEVGDDAVARTRISFSSR